jgi:pilus assembly protein CpaC
MMIKKTLITYLLIAASFVFGQGKPGLPSEDIQILLGLEKIIKVDFDFPTKGIDWDTNIVDIKFFTAPVNEISIRGKKIGRTDITLRDARNNNQARKQLVFNVVANEKSKIVGKLRELIGDVEGLKIDVKGEKVVVGGKIIVPGDIGRIAVVLDDFSKDLYNFIEVSPQLYEIIARKMQEGLRKNNLRDVTVRFFNNSYILEGIVGSGAEKQLAYAIAEAYLPDRIESLARRADAVQRPKKEELIKNFIVIDEKEQPPPVSKLIKITTQFVELAKDYNKVFGFKWTPTLGGDGGSISFGKTVDGGITTKSNGTLSGTISNLFPKLNSAKAAGYARVIQSGVVIAKDNVTAKLTKNTTKNFSLGSGEFSSPQSIQAGFNLEVQPQVLQEEKINLRISVGVSSAVQTDKLDNSVNTQIIVKSRESAVVGGVSVNKTTTEYDKDPPGGTDTVEDGMPIFAFIRSKEITKSKEQFVVFITPEIIENASTGTEEIQRKFRRRGR